MKTTCRRFLTRAAVGVGSALLAPQLLTQSDPAPEFFDPYESVVAAPGDVRTPGAAPWHFENTR